MSTAKERVLYLDVARTMALLLIVLNHVVNRTFDIYSEPYLEYETMPHYMSFIKALTSILSRVGVPLFLMITGAIMLNRTYKGVDALYTFYRKNWLGILITSEIWTFILYWTVVYVEHPEWYTADGIKDLLLNLLSTMLFINQTRVDSMWYIPMILAVYMMIPIFANAIRTLSLKAFIIPGIFIVLSTMVFPYISKHLLVFGIKRSYNLAIRSANLFSFYALYMLVGYWVSQRGLCHRGTSFLRGVAITAVMLTAGYQYWLNTKESGFVLNYDFFMYLPIAAVVFELIRRRFEGRVNRDNIFTYVSNRAFAVYFIHVAVIGTLKRILPLVENHQIFYMIYLGVGSILISFGITRILSLNKWAKKWMLYM